VIVLAALESEGLDATTLTQEAVLAEIEKALKDSSGPRSFEPFLYESRGAHLLPFFSTPDHAQTFCGEYSKERNRFFPFLTLTVYGSTLVSLLRGCDAIVLNPRTADEYTLSEADMRFLEETGLTNH